MLARFSFYIELSLNEVVCHIVHSISDCRHMSSRGHSEALIVLSRQMSDNASSLPEETDVGPTCLFVVREGYLSTDRTDIDWDAPLSNSQSWSHYETPGPGSHHVIPKTMPNPKPCVWYYLWSHGMKEWKLLYTQMTTIRTHKYQNVAEAGLWIYDAVIGLKILLLNTFLKISDVNITMYQDITKITASWLLCMCFNKIGMSQIAIWFIIPSFYRYLFCDVLHPLIWTGWMFGGSSSWFMALAFTHYGKGT